MSIRRNYAVASLNAAERMLRSARHPLSVLLRQSSFLSSKLFGYLLALIFICLFAVMPAIAVADDVEAVVYWNPWVTKTTTNSATINWYGSNSKAGNIEYDTSSYYIANGSFRNTKINETTVAYQHVQLSDLEPNTSYTYRVKTSDTTPHEFSVRTFQTMPVSGPFTFIVISDAHAQDKRFKYVADAIAANETDALFILDGGDFANYDDETLWAPFFQYGDGMLAKLPIFTAIGNHEYHNPTSGATGPTAAVLYHSSFNIPTNGPLNYFFDCSGIRFIILNSPDPNSANDEDPSLALSQSQVPWLEALLKKNMRGVFTIHHHPIWHYDRATSDSTLQPWETLYHQYHISANFAGHIHNYERHSVQGIPYFVVGNAGGKFADMNADAPYPPGYQVGETRQLGYLKVTVDPANNTATAQEIFIGSVETNSSTDVTLYTPYTYDTHTFSLKPRGSGGGNCFIATAAFGSYFDPSVKILRDFRDKFLITNHIGQSFVNWYYKVSPPLADLISTREVMKTIVRIILLPAVGVAYLCLNVGVLPALLLILFSAAFIYLGIRSFYRLSYASHV